MKKLVNIFLLAMGSSIFQTESLRAASQGDFEKNRIASLTTTTTKKQSFGANAANPESVAVVHVIRQGLPEFIRQIAERNGLQATVSAQVVGLVKDLRLPVDLERIMPQLADRFQLLWHMDQKRLFVSSNEERIQSRIRIEELNRDKLLNAITASGLGVGNNELTFLPDGETVMVSGEKSFIRKIEQVFQKFDGLRFERLGEIKAGGVNDGGN